MTRAILAPLKFRQTAEDVAYFDAISKNAEWVERARTPVLFADLPTNAEEGWQAPITDSTTAVFHAVIAGTGGNHVLGYFDGTNWRVGG